MKSYLNYLGLLSGRMYNENLKVKDEGISSKRHDKAEDMWSTSRDSQCIHFGPLQDEQKPRKLEIRHR